MKPLLVACLLLGALPHVATAQNVAPKIQPSQVPDWATTEFCDDYARYYASLPAAYKHLADNTLEIKFSGMHEALLEGELVRRADLREQVYKTLYDYCLGQQGPTAALGLSVYQLLYHHVRMTKAGATALAGHIMGRYGQEPVARLSTGDDGGGASMSGWDVATMPKVAAIDDNSGIVRFRIKINENGEVEGVTKVAGNVSPAQEKLCRDALQNASFRRTANGTGGAMGFYTFKITIPDSSQAK